MKYWLALTLTMLPVSGAAVLAQESPGLDIKAIRARAAENAADAEALAHKARSDAKALAEDAKVVRTNADQHANRYAETLPLAKAPNNIFDFDALIKESNDIQKQALAQHPRLIVFVSLSMPEAALKSLLVDAQKAGGIAVLRGLPHSDGEAGKPKLLRLFGNKNEAAALGIDPRLFRAFAIQSVPSFVIASGDIDLCDGLDCTSTPPPHDRLSGNISLAAALEVFADGDGPGAELAEIHLKKLEGRGS